MFNEELENAIENMEFDGTVEEAVFILENLYHQTKYPGYLHKIGEILYYGDCDLKHPQKDKGIEYYEKAAKEGYYKSKCELRSIYLGQACQSIYKAYQFYDDSEANEKFMMGNCLISNYFIVSELNQYNCYD